MIYGYARMSTDGQTIEAQVAALTAAGAAKVFREKIADTTADRPQLKKLVAALAYGDVVTVRHTAMNLRHSAKPGKSLKVRRNVAG
jgi:DNA invertase Pin-like site-specific DNA recombinase